MNFVKIKETCLYVRNLEQVKGFYEQLLGLPVISYLPGKHVFFKAGTSVLLIFNPDDSSQKKSPPPHYAHGKQHFALEVPTSEYENAKKEIARKGIRIKEIVQWPLGGESCYFVDTARKQLENIPDKNIWPD
jgi:catechol-2,3-dioxygenase